MDFAVRNCLLILLFLFPISANSQTNTNVTLGSSLTANNDNSPWTSPSGDFAFGFQQMESGGYLLAIWFNKIPERTIIWSANRNNLAPEGSRIQLFEDGRFVLSDSTGQQIWNSNTGGSEVAYGAMLDTGNFILARNTSATLWQSFDEPTDTFLPTQILGPEKRLVSSFSETNFSSGKFVLVMQSDGNLVIYTTNFPLDSVNAAYWDTRSVGSGFQFIFNQNGSVFLIARNGSLINSVFGNTASTVQYYQRVALEYDGVLRHYLYPKSSNLTGGRPMAWSIAEFLPSNICTRIGQATGSGACGFNSLCTLNSDQRPVCRCPSGYTFIDPNNSRSGCKPSFDPQSCDAESNEAENFGFIDMPNTDWPLSDFEHFQPVTEDWCRQVCLNDCFCAVAIFRGTDCYKKKYPLSNGRIDSSDGGKALVKIRQNNSTARPNEAGGRTNNRSHVIIIISTLLGSSVLLNILLFLSAFIFVNGLNRRKHKIFRPNPDLPGVNIRSFSYKELEEATDGFKEELGRGAYSIVYKGTIKHENGKIVAVKRLNNIVHEGDHEFKAEVGSISRTNHKNLVQLLGYCNEGKHRLLVYEFMANGSIASYLFDNPRPNWYKRVQIAFTTARGLCYLHDECSNQIIHCDIKPQNVLLDESLTAKISDFGLSKLLMSDQTKTTTGIRGTRGYVAPEWFRNMPITAKVDVYSFGILLLELVCCRKNIEPEATDEGRVILSDWACDCYTEENIHLLIGNDEEAQDDLKRFEKFVMIAIWCIQEDPSLRPTMKRVVQMLEGSVQVSAPPSPCSFISSIV